MRRRFALEPGSQFFRHPAVAGTAHYDRPPRSPAPPVQSPSTSDYAGQTASGSAMWCSGEYDGHRCGRQHRGAAGERDARLARGEQDCLRVPSEQPLAVGARDSPRSAECSWSRLVEVRTRLGPPPSGTAQDPQRMAGRRQHVAWLDGSRRTGRPGIRRIEHQHPLLAVSGWRDGEVHFALGRVE
jgi:hypothetical protein